MQTYTQKVGTSIYVREKGSNKLLSTWEEMPGQQLIFLSGDRKYRPGIALPPGSKLSQKENTMKRKITIEELERMIREEFGDQKDPAKLKVKQNGWEKAPIENDVDWMKTLKLKEMFSHLFEAPPEKFIKKTFTAPTSWAPYLINNDDSGMDPEEKRNADAWIKSVNMGSPTGVSDESEFMSRYDAMRFNKNLAADCSTYTFLRQK